ncbi:AAA domain-containing protein [Spirillospora sp. NPDC029432]|uniref:AAA domain-containing protein n=1 Tax=Spirillospora sp. NPDC029432 TaxID=3154599 RepID=UPI00345477AE
MDRAVPDPVPDLLRAVRSEIRAMLHDELRNAEKVSLRDGRVERLAGDEREYLFSCKRWNESFSVKDLVIRRVRSSEPWARAQVQRMPDGKVRVVTGADLGPAPVSAELAEDETAGLATLAERLEKAAGPDSPVNLSSAGWVVGQGRPRTARSGDADRLLPGYRGRRLNGRQRQAVEQALASEATFVWGPPGTGKTEVVSCIVEGCYRQGLRVLFLAPTHVAVDQAMERMCDLLSGEEGFDSGLVQRAGEIAVASFSTKYRERVSPDLIAERLASSLDAQITRIAADLKPLREGIARHEEAAAAVTEAGRLQNLLRSTDHEIGEAERGGQTASAHLQRVGQEIAAIGTPSGLFAQRKLDRLQNLQLEYARHHHAFELFRQRHETALRDRSRHSAALEAAQRTLAPLIERVRSLPPVQELRAVAEAAQKELNRLQDERQKIADAVRGRCRVMGTTVSKAVQSRKLMDTVDVVVVDEAGMVNLPSAWYAAGMAAKRVVVAGDFRQLPAVTRGSGSRTASPEDQRHSLQWMDRDAFHAAGLVDAQGTAVHGDPRMVALNEQYRMRPAICTLVNEVAYPDSPLLTGRADGSSLPPSPLIESSLVLVDTSARTLNGTGRDAHLSNPVHEAVIHELIRGLQYDTVLPARKAEGAQPTKRLAVISPYRSQKQALNASLTYRFGAEYDGLVDTVHRFQGSQRPLVIIDTVTGAGTKLGHFYEGTGLSSATCRLLNVALSRAQDHLVVVANVDFMSRMLSRGSEAGRMLRHLERHAQRIPVDDLVPVRSAADLGGLDEEELARPAFFPADEVARAVEWDIVHARGSIDIYCAFLSAQAVRHWLRHLAPRAAEGVRVTVHTRRHEPGTQEAELVRLLETSGCQVTARERMHEKVLILDDTVLWHGSLNLLAHSGSTDLMMRITDPAACERVRHIVERARMDRPARTPPRHTSNGDRGRSGGGRSGGADTVRPGSIVGDRLYLAVPYEERHEAKRVARARFDWDRKLWHVDVNVPRDSVRQWLPGNG